MRAKLFLLAVVTVGLSSFGLGKPPGAPPDVPSRDYAGRPVGERSVPEMAAPGAGAEVRENLSDILFDFEKSDLRPDQQQKLEQNAAWLKAHPDVHITIEGDADERGDIVYNVALSDHRAVNTRDALVALGVPAEQIVFATGWGELYPTCKESDEACWTQNRRAHFTRW